MKKGFYTIMAAQFFSSLADNALFVAAVELLKSSGQPEWQRAALVPTSQLVKANGWIEGLTIASIILGVLLGGQLVGRTISHYLLGFDMPIIDTGIDTPPEAAIASMILLYAIAAVFNLRIPRTEA